MKLDKGLSKGLDRMDGRLEHKSWIIDGVVAYLFMIRWKG